MGTLWQTISEPFSGLLEYTTRPLVDETVISATVNECNGDFSPTNGVKPSENDLGKVVLAQGNLQRWKHVKGEGPCRLTRPSLA
jgi:hypothetical protein